jgi:hypothetical protein
MTRIQFSFRFKGQTLFKYRRQTDIALHQFMLLLARYECPIGPLAGNQFLQSPSVTTVGWILFWEETDRPELSSWVAEQ